MMQDLAIGVDFGATNIKLGLVARTGRVLATSVLPAQLYGAPARFVEAVGEAVERLLQARRIQRSRIAGAVVGAPGPVDHARGIVHTMVNVRGWREVPLARLMTRRLGCRTLVENDVNLIALGEWRHGAGRGAAQMVCLTLGTGVGGGLILGGGLYRGHSGAAGEIGHMAIDPQGPRCGCGARGCLEAYVGAAAICRMGGVGTPKQLSQAAQAGDRQALRVWREFGQLLGLGVASLINVLNPDRVVIGGGVSSAWRFFAPTLQRTVRTQAMAAALHNTQIVRAKLGDQAGIVGSAVLIWDPKSATSNKRQAAVSERSS